MTLCCLTLLCPPELEEKIVDLLLVDAAAPLFSSAPSFTHGLHPQSLDRLEKVLGLGHSVSLQLLLDRTAADALLERLRSIMAGTGVTYWMTHVLDTGEL